MQEQTERDRTHRPPSHAGSSARGAARHTSDRRSRTSTTRDGRRGGTTASGERLLVTPRLHLIQCPPTVSAKRGRLSGRHRSDAPKQPTTTRSHNQAERGRTPRKRLDVGAKPQANGISTKKKANGPTPYCNDTGQCRGSENIHTTVPEAISG